MLLQVFGKAHGEGESLSDNTKLKVIFSLGVKFTAESWMLWMDKKSDTEYIHMYAYGNWL